MFDERDVLFTAAAFAIAGAAFAVSVTCFYVSAARRRRRARDREFDAMVRDAREAEARHAGR